MMALRTDEELLECMDPSVVDRHGVRFFEPLPAQILNFIWSGLVEGRPRMNESAPFAAALRAYYGDETFASAFARTGRIVCISCMTYSGVTGAGAEHALVLNYLTAPDVLLWSAVAGSCALPGLMPPVALMAIDGRCVAAPFHVAHGIQSVGGSMAG